MDIIILGKYLRLSDNPSLAQKLKNGKYFSPNDFGSNDRNMVLNAYSKISGNLEHKNLGNFDQIKNARFTSVLNLNNNYKELFEKNSGIAVENTSFTAFEQSEKVTVIYSKKREDSITIDEIVSWAKNRYNLENIYVLLHSSNAKENWLSKDIQKFQAK